MEASPRDIIVEANKRIKKQSGYVSSAVNGQTTEKRDERGDNINKEKKAGSQAQGGSSIELWRTLTH